LTEALLLFLGRDGGFDGWLQLSGGSVAARAAAGDSVPAAPKGARLVAVAPGEAVALHWLDLPSGLAPAQAAAAARLMAAELSAQPPGEMHVALGREAGEGARCVALVPAAAMTEWLARLAAAGFDPDHVVPETLLVQAPETGILAFGRGATALYRGPSEAFAIEPELARAVLGEREVTQIDASAFEAGLGAALSPPLLDLRQGPFARRRQWQLERRRLRRFALLALAIAAVSLLIQVAAILRYTFAADAAENEAKRVATAALPRAGALGDPSQDLGRRLAELRGGGVGYGAIAASVFEAVRGTPNVELTALSFSQDGSLRATVQADSAASLGALAERVEGRGFAADVGGVRSGGGRQMAELTVRPR
jgi:general secretion pathway protein L